MEMGISSEVIVVEDVEEHKCDLNKDSGSGMMDFELNNNEDETVAAVEINVGMEFDTSEELYDLWREYAIVKGFPVRKRTSKKDSDGITRYVKFTCSREGNRTSRSNNLRKPRPVSALGCKAHVTARYHDFEKWVITSVVLDHNHDCSPSLFRCNSKPTPKAKRGLASRDQTGVSVPKSFRVSVGEAGRCEEVPYISEDAGNCVEKMGRLRLREGDASAMRSYFLKMQKQNKDFYYSIDIDDCGRLDSVFWADGRSRLAYKDFGEVVTFDTTCLTNKYDIPFVTFVGVNHHGQSMLLGCGLVSHETRDTFIWLFNAWLACMNGRAPQGIITDQDPTMQNAISIVFPDTIHRWCLRHIVKKVPEKLNSHTSYHSIVHDLHDVVYDSHHPEEFEQGWIKMVEKYKLEENTWLGGLYEERSRWVPVYVKTQFWAGMSTTQRGESMNAFFDGYVNHKTTLKQLVEQYDAALRCKIEKEIQEDFKSFSKLIPLRSKFKMEKQVQDVYTISKFKEFQDEFNAQIYCRTISRQTKGTMAVYEIKQRIMFSEGEKNVIFTVVYDNNLCETECSCHLFEYRGTVCRHLIHVFVENEVDVLPEKFIMNRWRKDVKRPYSRIQITDSGWVVTPEQKRYDELCAIFSEISYLVSMDEDYSHELMEWLKWKQIEVRKHQSFGGKNNPSPATSNPRKNILSTYLGP